MSTQISTYKNVREMFYRGQIDLVSNTIKVALITDNYSPDYEHTDFIAQIKPYELVNDSYTPGGAVLNNARILTNEDDANIPYGHVRFDADDVSFNQLNGLFRFGVIYITSTNTPLALILFDDTAGGINVEIVNTNWKIVWSYEGIFNSYL